MQFYIGTSGYLYKDWNNGAFYPRGVKDRLSYALQKMTALEINSSFYRIPPPDTVASWAERVPAGRRLVLKAPQSVSHRRRLKLHSEGPARQGADLLDYFITGIKRIPAARRGPVLLQLPGNLEADPSRLEPVLKVFHAQRVRVALEIRHASWFTSVTLGLLEKYRCALVASDWPEFSTPLVATCDFLYLRRHGPAALYASNYKDDALLADIDRLQSLAAKSAYVFFNNDVHAYAPNNAVRMLELLRGR